jgi:hypothetical protein
MRLDKTIGRYVLSDCHCCDPGYLVYGQGEQGPIAGPLAYDAAVRFAETQHAADTLETMTMNRWADRLVSEATLQAADELGSIRKALDETGHITLATMARQPHVIEAVNRAREIVDKATWETLNRPGEELTEEQRRAAKLVWDMLPGYTCLMDAVAILARL